MLTYHLKKDDGSILYEELFDHIRQDILSGTLKKDQKLPSKRALSKHLKISITTVENAYHKLMDDQYIRSEPGRGFFVDFDGSSSNVSDGSRFQGWNAAVPSRLKAVFSDVNMPPLPQEEETDPSDTFSMDFKGNKCSMTLFPAKTWMKLMRMLISGNDAELFESIPYNGHYSLRKAIADYLKGYRGMNVDPSMIIIGAGTEFLYRRLMEILGPGTMVAFEDPGYKQLAQICVNSGGLYSYIPIDNQGISSQILANSNTDVVHVSPANHFPTGTIMSESRRKEVLQWAYETPYRYIIEDDYDCEFSSESAHLSTLYSMDRQDRVIYINTFSKSLVSSIRISYMILPRSLMALYRSTLGFYACSASGFEQQTLARFISDGYFERHLDRLINYYEKKKNSFISAVEASPFSGICNILKGNAGTHLLIQVHTSMNDDEIKKRASDLSIKVSLLSDYCNRPRPAYLRTLVINYAGMENSDIKQAVSLLEQMFEKDLSSLS